MFKIAKSATGTIRLDAGAGPVEVTFDFRWLPMSQRMTVTENHDKAVEALTTAETEDDAKPGNKIQQYNLLHADLILDLATGWSVLLEDGGAAPFDRPTIAAFLDFFPAAFGMIVAASHQATSIRAIEGN